MKKENLILLLLALLLLAAMLYTIFAGGERSRHGYGLQPPDLPFPDNETAYGPPDRTG